VKIFHQSVMENFGDNGLLSNILNFKNDRKQFKNELYVQVFLNNSFYSVKNFLDFSRDN